MIQSCELPNAALLAKYRESGGYTDCYCTEIARSVSQAQFIEAFYTSWVFKLERMLLAWFVARPSTDRQARALAVGGRDEFAAWHVEGRTENQLLMCDLHARTRSWLMTVAVSHADVPSTRLHFGSAVLPTPRGDGTQMGFAFRALLGFHRVYSRVLLRVAVSRLLRSK